MESSASSSDQELLCLLAVAIINKPKIKRKRWANEIYRNREEEGKIYSQFERQSGGLNDSQDTPGSACCRQIE